jgi:hypothetical protein
MGALKAQLPGEVPAGSYQVRVSDGGALDVEVGLLTIIAPTPTPRPTAIATPPPPAPPGQPILTLRNYTVTPEQVRPGQEFEVAIEIYNNGSRAGENTLAIFPGGTFLPLGEKGHQLWQLHINATVVVTQRMRAPASIANMELRLEGLPFVGPLDPGGSAPIDLSVVPQVEGPGELTLAIRYRDDFNQVQVISETLSVEVQGGPDIPDGQEGPRPGGPYTEPPSETATETFWQKLGRALRGFFGLGS